MKTQLLKIILLLILPFLSYSKDENVKTYSTSECEKLGLQPILLPDGTVIMPKDDGEHFLVRSNLPNSAGITPEQVVAFFSKAQDHATRVYDRLMNIGMVENLPIVIEKKTAGTKYEIGLSEIIFTPAGNSLSIYAMITTVDGKKICFAGEQVGFTGQGGIKEGVLKLLLGADNSLKLLKLEKVALELTGGALKFDCDGYKSFSIAGKVIFDRTLIVPDNILTGEPAAGNVNSAFVLEDVEDFNNMLIRIEMQPFQLPNMKGYGFDVQNAVIDVSDSQNTSNLAFPNSYTAAESDETWRGVYIGNVSVRFPKAFKNRVTQKRLTVGVNRLLIDRFGVSGEVFGENIIGIKEGDLNGWDYSIDGASIILVKSQVKAGSLEGKMRVAVSSEEQLLGYKAIIDPTRDFYNFTVKTEESLEFAFLKATEVHLNPNSAVSLKLQNGEFTASALLHGKLNIVSVKEDVSLQEYTFQDFFVSTRAPYLSIGYFGGGSDKEQKLGNFPITLIAPKVLVQNNVAHVEFGLKVNLDNIGIEAEGGFSIDGAFVNRDNRHFWEHKKFAINKLFVEADLGSVGDFSGEVNFFTDDPVYGKGFAGNMTLDLYAAEADISAVAIFGKKQERYWFVDGVMQPWSGGGDKLSINLLAGCLYKRMKPVGMGGVGFQSLSGVTYTPDFNVGWGGRFGIGLSVPGGKAVSVLAGLEIATRADGSINNIGILGSVSVAGGGGDNSPEKAKQLYQMISADSDFLQPGGIANRNDDPNAGGNAQAAQKFYDSNEKGFSASVILKINYTDKSYYGKVGVGVTTGTFQLQVLGAFLFSPNKWFVHLGEPPIQSRIVVLVPGIPKIDGYIMLGHGIAELPEPEPNIFSKYPAKRGERTADINSGQIASAKGIAFGAAIEMSSSGSFPKNAPILSYSIGGRAGLDMMLMRYGSGAYCVGREGQSVGLNQWRAGGQVYAIGWFKGAAFGFNVLDIGLGALLKGKTPNPTYATGEVAVSFKVLFKRFTFDAGFQIGDNCEVIDGPIQVQTEDVITGNFPANDATDVDEKTRPYIIFGKEVEKEIKMDGIDGLARLKVKNYNLTDEKGNNIEGNWEAIGTQLNFIPKSQLPGGKIKVSIAVVVETQTDGTWKAFVQDGQEISANKEYYFTTNAFAIAKQEMQNEAANVIANIEQNTEAVIAQIEVLQENYTNGVTTDLANDQANIDNFLDYGSSQSEILAAQYEASNPNSNPVTLVSGQIVPAGTNPVTVIFDNAITQTSELLTAALDKKKALYDIALIETGKLFDQAKIDVKDVADKAKLVDIPTLNLAYETALDKIKADLEAEINRINAEKDVNKAGLENIPDPESKKYATWQFNTVYQNAINRAKQKANDDIEAEKKKTLVELYRIENEVKARQEAIFKLAKEKCDAIMEKARLEGNGILQEAFDKCASIMAAAEAESKTLISGTTPSPEELEKIKQNYLAAGSKNILDDPFGLKNPLPVQQPSTQQQPTSTIVQIPQATTPVIEASTPSNTGLAVNYELSQETKDAIDKAVAEQLAKYYSDLAAKEAQDLAEKAEQERIRIQNEVEAERQKAEWLLAENERIRIEQEKLEQEKLAREQLNREIELYNLKAQEDEAIAQREREAYWLNEQENQRKAEEAAALAAQQYQEQQIQYLQSQQQAVDYAVYDIQIPPIVIAPMNFDFNINTNYDYSSLVFNW
jgi:hypothetical protein